MLTYPLSASFLNLRFWRSLSTRKKAIWVVAVLWCLLHVGATFGTMLADPAYERTNSDIANSSDIAAYLQAADTIKAREPLYALMPWPGVMVYYYHPIFALAVSAISDISFRTLSVLN